MCSSVALRMSCRCRAGGPTFGKHGGLACGRVGRWSARLGPRWVRDPVTLEVESKLGVSYVGALLDSSSVASSGGSSRSLYPTPVGAWMSGMPALSWLDIGTQRLIN